MADAWHSYRCFPGMCGEGFDLSFIPHTTSQGSNIGIGYNDETPPHHARTDEELHGAVRPLHQAGVRLPGSIVRVRVVGLGQGEGREKSDDMTGRFIPIGRKTHPTPPPTPNPQIHTHPHPHIHTTHAHVGLAGRRVDQHVAAGVALEAPADGGARRGHCVRAYEKDERTTTNCCKW